VRAAVPSWRENPGGPPGELPRGGGRRGRHPRWQGPRRWLCPVRCRCPRHRQCPGRPDGQPTRQLAAWRLCGRAPLRQRRRDLACVTHADLC